MKSKSKVKGILMLSILLPMFAFTVRPALAQGTATLKLQQLPPIPNYGPGKNFRFDIYVQDVTDLKSFDLTLSFNASLLTIVNSTINTIDPVSQLSNGFRIPPAINDTNQAMGYIRLSADRGPSGQINNEIVGTGDGVSKVFFLANPRIQSGSAQIYVGGTLQSPSSYDLDLNTGRIIFGIAPALGKQIKANYIHPGLTTADPFMIVEIGFNVTDRGTCAMDITDSSLIDINNDLMVYDVVNTVFDNRFQGHLEAPNYINGTIMAGEEFSIVVTVSNVLIETEGISFFLYYNTNILVALSGGDINETAGYVYVKQTGLSLTTVDPIPFATIGFYLITNGYSPLGFTEVTAVSTTGEGLWFDYTNGTVSTLHDIDVTNVTPSATQVAQGSTLPINVTVANEGNFTQTFDVTAFYNSTPIVPAQTVTALASGESKTLFFYWDTTGIAEGNYTIKAVASTVPGETETSDNTFIDGTVKIAIEPIISINPTLGPAGTKLEVTGINFGAFEHMAVYFDDMFMAEVDADGQGSWTAIFNVPIAEPTTHTIRAVGLDITKQTTFNVVDTSPMDISIEVGQTYFRGEIAEFYVQTAFKGEPVDATSLTATLRKPDGTTQALTNQHVATGLYKTTYTLPADAPTGTYVVEAEADYVTDTTESKGTKIGSFLLSPTLTGWNAMLISIDGTVATVKTDVGLIKLDLDAIDPLLTGIDTNVDTILGKILAVQGDVATIKTDVGTIKATINGWTGATISSVVTPTGTFNLLALTTSSSLDSLKLQDNTITVVVSGPAGTSRTTNVILPKQFLAAIGTTVGQIEATVNDQKATVQHTEDPNMYVISINYTAGANTIKIFLTGMPPTQPPIPITILLLIIFAIVVVAVVVTAYMRRRSKKPADQSTNP